MSKTEASSRVISNFRINEGNANYNIIIIFSDYIILSMIHLVRASKPPYIVSVYNERGTRGPFLVQFRLHKVVFEASSRHMQY